MTLMPEDNLAYTIAGIGRKRDPYAERRTMAQRLLAQGMDTSPVQSPWQGAARLAQALMGGIDSYTADRDEKKATDDRAAKLKSAIARMKTDPEGGLAEAAALDPEYGIRSASQLAVEKVKQGQLRDTRQGAADRFGASYGAPSGISTPPLASPGPRMAPEQVRQQGQQHVQYLVNVHGFTPEQAQLMVGNLVQESTLDPGYGFNKPGGDGGTAVGMGQWRLDRREALIREAQARGEDPANPTTQLDFYANEFKTRPEFQQFQNAKTPEERQAALMAYFRPAGYTPNNPQGGDGYANRLQYSQQFSAPPATGQPQPLTINMGGPGGVPQGSADTVGMPPAPSPQGVQGPTMMAQAPQAARPPAVPDVPRPRPTQDQIQRAQRLIMEGATPAQAEAALNAEIDRDWAVQRERAKMQFQQQSDAFKEERGRNQPSRQEVEKLQTARSEAATIVSALEDFRREFENTGTWGAVKSMAGATTPVNTAYNAAALLAKGEQLFNLGVLNGPDLDIIRRTLPDPSTFKGATASNADMGSAVNKVIDLLQTRLAARERQLGLPVTDVRGTANEIRATMPGGQTPQPSNGPIAPGAIEEGYRFKGGNPADKNNWERVR